jgi:hypothetical protein
MLAGVLHPDFGTINVVLQRESKNIFTVSSPYTKREREKERANSGLLICFAMRSK